MGRARQQRIFILSPANSGGERARLLFNPRARFELAHRLQAGEAVPIGEIFSFLSGLYFRGKHAYAARFASPPRGVPGSLVITTNRGLLPADLPITLQELDAFAKVDIDPADPAYLQPLLRSAEALKEHAPKAQCVLLGSIGTKKYAEVLMEIFGEALHFPVEFVGRGDMSRGGLLLRKVAEGVELEYVPVRGAIRHGQRPAKLAPRSWGYRVTEGRTPLPGKSE
ncbi:MAG TPA: hypothetical protein VEH27_05955 [Methylomirabilota bacterium]|nr:hypothetical protein [Methylomirabilota bacterium]